MRTVAVIVGFIALSVAARAADVDEAALRKSVVFYASFDEKAEADAAGGVKTLQTRFNHEKEKGQFVFEKGFDDKVFRIAKDKGIAGGALEAVDVLPRNGRIFFPAKGNVPFKKDGWSGTLSVWIKTDPDELLKTRFCDPIQITQKGANNGGLWFDFNDAKPRDLRLGAFPAVPEGKDPIKEEDAKAPMVRVPKVGFKKGDWHHIVMVWKNLDTGKADAVAALYIDGKLIGEVKDRAIAMAWDLEKTGIYVAVNYIGLLDELAIFSRALSAEEVAHLHKQPKFLQKLPKPEEEEAKLRIRMELQRFLQARAGSALQVPIIDLLLRLPPLAKDAPLPPMFPFEATEAQRYQNSYADWLGLPVEITNDIGMTFVLVPPGTFLMGSPKDEPGHGAGGFDETQHEVTLSRPFYLGKREVTVGQFRRFVEATKHETDGEKNGGGHAHDDKADWKHRPGTCWRDPGYAGPYKMQDDHPAVHVSHNDARAFCAWLQKRADTKSNSVYDLPTEAQWEWACRAGSGTRYIWGKDEDETGKHLNAGDKTLKQVHPDWPRKLWPMDDGHAFVAPVGSFQANAFGLHDLLGNVWEFCSTRSGPYPGKAVTDPGDLDPKRGFAVRGGGWSNIPNDVRCATRNADPPQFCHSNLGFRVVLQLPARR